MASPSKSFYAVVAGVGPGTGGAVAKRFAKAYPVILLARREESYKSTLEEITQAGGRAVGISTDVSDPAAVKHALALTGAQLDALQLGSDAKLAAAVYNASVWVRKPFLELEKEDIEKSMQGNTYGLFNFAQATLPGLLEAVDTAPHPPTLIVTGATASIRGSAKFAGFAAGKFAKRAIAQSLAREFGPQGVHVAHAIIDGGIDIPRLANDKSFNNGVENGKISPDAIADSYWYLHTQPRSSFTQELDIRPFVEKF